MRRLMAKRGKFERSKGRLDKGQREKATFGFKSWERGALLLARTGERSS